MRQEDCCKYEVRLGYFVLGFLLTKSNSVRKGKLSTSLFITEGSQDRNSQGRNLEAGADTEAMEECCLLVDSPWLAQPAL